MHHVFVTMGTVASITVPGRTEPVVLSAAERVFERADALFSLHRPDSELSRINRGDLALTDSSTAVRSAYGVSMEWGSRTGGFFTPNRPDGSIDLNGVVKALAITEAGAVLDGAGLDDWSINVGGDILFRGSDPSGSPWRTGVVNPADRGALLCAIDLASDRRAIATSGTAERGDHIWRRNTTEPPELVQVTVVANRMLDADVLATAMIAGGEILMGELTARWDIDVLAVRRTGEMLATPGIRSALAKLRP